VIALINAWFVKKALETAYFV